MTLHYTVTESALGKTLVAGTGRGLCAIRFGKRVRDLEKELRRDFRHATLKNDDSHLSRWVTRVLDLIEHPAKTNELPLDIRGTAFQKKVWLTLRKIPAGQTVSYGEVARRIGRPRAVRAVASACGANPVAVVIPCHRVIGTNGKLSGYRWGLKRKQQLLNNERKSKT